MAGEKFKVSNPGGMWVRSEPVVTDATRKVLLPKGQLVTKLGGSDKPDWWRITSNFSGADGYGPLNGADHRRR